MVDVCTLGIICRIYVCCINYYCTENVTQIVYLILCAIMSNPLKSMERLQTRFFTPTEAKNSSVMSFIIV